MTKRNMEFTDPDLDRKAFADRLRVALESSGFRSGNALAAELGCSQQSVHSWLKSVSEPGRDRLVALSAALDVTINWLATGEPVSLRDNELQLSIDEKKLSDLRELERNAESVDELHLIKEQIIKFQKYLAASSDYVNALRHAIERDGYGGKIMERVQSISLSLRDRGDSREAAAKQSVDQDLMGRCSDAFGKLYKEMGITLSMADLGSLAAQAYNDLAAAGAQDMDIPTQLAMIRPLVERHRREILAESAANAKGKRSAS